MMKMLSAAALLLAMWPAGLAVAGDLNAEAQYYKDPFYYQGHGHSHGSRYNADPGSNPAFTQGCPAGSSPQSFPNQSGRRCALPGGGYTY